MVESGPCVQSGGKSGSCTYYIAHTTKIQGLPHQNKTGKGVTPLVGSSSRVLSDTRISQYREGIYLASTLHVYRGLLLREMF